MPPHLPGELVDAIISHIDDASSLCSCALVRRDWVAASRHHLFGDAHILSPSQYGALVNRVLRSENMYPWLSSMHTMEIDCEDARWHNKRNRSSRFAFFHDFAGHLPNLYLLSLVGLDWAKSPLHPSTPSMVTRFPSLVRLRLENCTFQSFDIFRRILVAIPALSALTLYAVQWPSRQGSGAYSPPQLRPCLVSFSIQFYVKNDCAETLFNWLVNCTPSKSTMRHLRFSLGGSPKAALKPEHVQFLEAVSLSVKSLRIQARDGFPISAFFKLTHLSIKGDWESICRTLQNLDAPLCVLQIETVPTRVSPRVRDIALAPRQDEDEGTDVTGGLEELDTILEGDRFKKLELLEFTLSPVPREFNFMLSLVEGRLREGIEERLPKLCGRGVRILPSLVKGRGLSQRARAAMHLSR